MNIRIGANPSIRFDVKDVVQPSATADVEVAPESARSRRTPIRRQSTARLKTMRAPIVQDDLKDVIMPTLKAPPRGNFVRSSANGIVVGSNATTSPQFAMRGFSVDKEVSQTNASMYDDGWMTGEEPVDERPNTVGAVPQSGKGPGSGKRRPNSGSSVRRHPPPGRWINKPNPIPWKSSSVCEDRDILAMQNDLEILNYRNKYRPDLLYRDPQADSLPKPVLRNVSDRQKQKGANKVDTKQRCLHHSFRAVANNDLPFHPKLKELNDHGIHSDRWCVGYDRLGEEIDLHKYTKPAIRTQRMDHEAFWREFHQSQYEEEVEDEVEVFRHVTSIASSYSRRGRK